MQVASFNGSNRTWEFQETAEESVTDDLGVEQSHSTHRAAALCPSAQFDHLPFVHLSDDPTSSTWFFNTLVQRFSLSYHQTLSSMTHVQTLAKWTSPPVFQESPAPCPKLVLQTNRRKRTQ